MEESQSLKHTVQPDTGFSKNIIKKGQKNNQRNILHKLSSTELLALKRNHVNAPIKQTFYFQNRHNI